jgi:putative restriction endonuclease
MVERRNWSEEEVQRALLLYLRTPFGRIHQRNPDIISLAQDLGRSVSSIALKMVNLASLDDSLAQKGMANTSALDRKVWRDFILAPEPAPSTDFYTHPSPRYGGLSEEGHAFADGAGRNVPVTSTRRVGQDLFREAVLASYHGRCAVTGIDDPRLLNASHIVPWTGNEDHRALHDRAFDRHIITFDRDWCMIVRDDVPAAAKAALLRGAGSHLRMPDRFLPDPDLLAVHRAVFERAA